MNAPRNTERGFSAELLEKSWLTQNTFELRVTRPENFRFESGQFIRFFQGDMERDYSIISGPNEPFLGFCVRDTRQGRMSSCLAKIPTGTRLRLSGPMGYFTFKRADHPAVFVATGTGIAPFVSMTRSGISGFILLHGVPCAADLYYRTELEAAAWLYVPCFSKEISEQGAHNGRVTDYLANHLPSGAYDFYLCGRREMIGDCLAVLDERFPDARVFTEIFY